ncbi:MULTISPECIES: aldo/keto reductase [unclassified Beijerinckia]|uniref:aldo/keto reductase n=1 Tax=unclassified Beijerinckia TaxID=2638183 RepID=UPI00089915EE|nr:MULTISPECIES: aldo/keto reductase [unclassified Beijerinckia]MDH7795271.1 aryl-alcohol dehydrogenase-like predicted oxidoreductase [Beijerinckia sp. GAS462]SEB94609.1 Predicted oxidoreductase [Beijerinckia sp. 28-YEA-48]
MSTSKKLRQIGKSGIETPAIGLGCMSLTGTYGASTDEASIDVIRAALDNGVTLLDSSDMYGDGKNEELIAQAIKGRRDQAVIATKFGNLGGRGGKFADGKPETVVRSCEASLKRLGIETIDLYYQHRIDPDVPVEETVGAMAQLVAQGKVRALGLSEASPETIRRAHKVHPIAAVQNEFSLLYRTEAEETRQTTRDLGISFVAYSPLGRSLLTAAVVDDSSFTEGDARRRHPRFAADNLARNVDLVGRLKTIAEEKRCTPGQLALAWLLAQGDDVIAIPGTKRRERLIENIGALNVELGADDLRRIAEAIPKGAAAGLRYPEGQMGSVFL